MFDLIQGLFAIDWSGVITAAVASGVGLTVVTQLLKTKWVKVPATKYPRAVTAVLAVVVGIIGTLASGLALSSLTSLIVFAVVAFVVSGLAYDGVKGLVKEVKTDDDYHPDMDIQNVEIDKYPEDNQPEPSKLNAKPTVDEVAQQIVDGEGDWGNGAERRENVRNAGFNYNEVQAKVK